MSDQKPPAMPFNRTPEGTPVGELVEEHGVASIGGDDVVDEHAIHGDHGDHTHGPDCGHEAVDHDDHVDYLHDGHRHAHHGDHYDEH